jgi:hypothetical protein
MQPSMAFGKNRLRFSAQMTVQRLFFAAGKDGKNCPRERLQACFAASRASWRPDAA